MTVSVMTRSFDCISGDSHITDETDLTAPAHRCQHSDGAGLRIMMHAGGRDPRLTDTVDASHLEEQADGGEHPLVRVHAVERFDLVNQRSLMWSMRGHLYVNGDSRDVKDL